MTSKTARDVSRADARLLQVLPAVTLLAVLTITASAEYGPPITGEQLAVTP
jgi:hypothetical protein